MTSNMDKDLSIVITSFFLKCAGFWLAKDQREQRIRDWTLKYTVLAVLFAVWTQSVCLYFTWGDFSEGVYIACNMMSLFIVLYKIFVLFPRRTEFKNMILDTQKNFWHGNYNSEELDIVLQCKKMCVFFVFSFTGLALCTVGCYAITPIIGNIGGNVTDRELPFKIWFDIPYWKTPYYQIIFTIQTLSTLHVGICYFCFDNFLCILNIHTAGQFRILQRRLMLVCGNQDTSVDNNRNIEYDESNRIPNKHNKLKKLIHRHKKLISYVENIEETYTLIIIGQMLVFSILICLDGYQVLSTTGPASRRTIFVGHLGSTTVQLLMITYSSHGLIEESIAVGDAIYKSLWYTLPMDEDGRKIRKDLKLIQMRSRQPCCLTAGGFFTISLETFMTVMRTAMSYFTLLRQCAEGN